MMRGARSSSGASRVWAANCRRGAGLTPSGSQIQPVIVGSDERAVALAKALQAHGFDIRAVRPPTVPEGTSRLRIALTLNVDDEAVDAMVEALAVSFRGWRHEPRFVIAGTDTDVGKTVFAAGLATALEPLLEAGSGGPGEIWHDRSDPRLRAGMMLCTAGTDAAEAVRLGVPADRVLPEAYRLTQPLSPHRAARSTASKSIRVIGAARSVAARHRVGGRTDGAAETRSSANRFGRAMEAAGRAGGAHGAGHDQPLAAVVRGSARARNPDSRYRFRRRSQRRHRAHNRRDGRRSCSRPASAHRVLQRTRWRSLPREFPVRGFYLMRSPVWHPFTQHALMPPPPIVTRAEGAWLETSDGKRILDAISSWWVVTHGHRHPHIVSAIKEQADKLDQVIFAGHTHEPAETLAAKLVEIAPPDCGMCSSPTAGRHR